MAKKRKKMSYSIQTRDYLWYHGAYAVDKTEYFDLRTKRNHDLFTFADWIAVFQDKTVLVQETSRGNVAARKKKIISKPESKFWMIHPGHEIWVLGWDKTESGFRVRKIVIRREEVASHVARKPQAKDRYWKEG